MSDNAKDQKKNVAAKTVSFQPPNVNVNVERPKLTPEEKKLQRDAANKAKAEKKAAAALKKQNNDQEGNEKKKDGNQENQKPKKEKKQKQEGDNHEE